jgi:hypothetical protein
MTLAAVRIELSKTAPVEILKIGVSARERQIDVVEHSCFTRARLIRPTWHQPFGKRRQGGGIVVVEEGSMLSAAWMLMGRGIGLLVLLKLGVRLGHEPRTCNGARANRCANQECSASGIMLGHACSSLCVFEPGFPDDIQTCENNSNFSDQCHRP